MVRQLISEGETRKALDEIDLLISDFDGFRDELAMHLSRWEELEKERTHPGTNLREVDGKMQKQKYLVLEFYKRIERQIERFVIRREEEIVGESFQSRLKLNLLKNYRLEDTPLGEGSTCVIYRAEELYSRKTVAIRAIKNQNFNKKQIGITEEGQSLKAEIDKVLKLRHRNLIKISGTYFDNFPICYVEDYVDGPTLDKILKYGPLPLEETINIISQLGDALYYLHSKRIKHKRIRPWKIFIDSEGLPVISPFEKISIFSGSDTDKLAEELMYFSPEELTEVKVGEESDQFALGLLMYHLLSGKPLFYGENLIKIFRSREHFFKNPEKRKACFEALDIPKKKEVIAILKKMLHVDAGKRFISIKAAITEMEKLIDKDCHAYIVKESYQRCCAKHPQLTNEFYLNLFIRYPHLIPYFSKKRCSENQQTAVDNFVKKLQEQEPGHPFSEPIQIPEAIQIPKKMLRVALAMLFTDDRERNYVSNIVQMPNHQNVGIIFYMQFLNTLIETVQKNDFLWSRDEKIEKAWQVIRGNTLDKINMALLDDK